MLHQYKIVDRVVDEYLQREGRTDSKGTSPEGAIKRIGYVRTRPDPYIEEFFSVLEKVLQRIDSDGANAAIDALPRRKPANGQLLSASAALEFGGRFLKAQDQILEALKLIKSPVIQIPEGMFTLPDPHKQTRPERDKSFHRFLDAMPETTESMRNYLKTVAYTDS